MSKSPKTPADGDGREADGSFDTYLREIGRTPLLSRQEEAELAAEIQAGRRELRACTLALEAGGDGDPAAAAAGVRRAKARIERARSRFIEANLRLVVAICRRYPTRGLGLLDLVQEGNIGLMQAVDRFDPGFGCRFSTYAAPWIRQAVLRASLMKSRVVRPPHDSRDLLMRKRCATRELAQELGREPALDEIAARAGVSIERLLVASSLHERSVSLDVEASADDDRSLTELLEDPAAVDPDEASAVAELDRHAELLLARLGEREQELLRARFAPTGQGPCTLAEVGARFGISRERVRQIEVVALRRLRRFALQAAQRVGH